MRASPVALLKEQIVEQAREIAELQHKLAKQDDGSLFDLKHDKRRRYCDRHRRHPQRTQGQRPRRRHPARLKK